MYLPTVLGDTRIPSLTKRSLAIRSSPHNGILCGYPANQAAQFWRNRASARPALPAPKDPPGKPVPANDGRRSYDDDRIAPIEESGEQCEADASRMIHASGFD